MLARWRRRKALREMRARLPILMRREYGHAAPYTAEQVRCSLRRAGLADGLLPSALAWLATNDAFASLPGNGGRTPPDRDELLEELAAVGTGFGILGRGRNREGGGWTGDPTIRSGGGYHSRTGLDGDGGGGAD